MRDCLTQSVRRTTHCKLITELSQAFLYLSLKKMVPHAITKMKIGKAVLEIIEMTPATSSEIVIPITNHINCREGISKFFVAPDTRSGSELAKKCSFAKNPERSEEKACCRRKFF